MALDKLVDSSQLDADLTSVADAIRTKGGTSASLAFPSGFVSAVEAISTGGGGGLEYDSGTFTLASDYGGGAGGYAIAHSLGEVPAVIIIWTDYFEDEENTPDKNTNIGYVYLTGFSSLPQRLSSSNSASDGLAAYMYMASGDRRIFFGSSTSEAYMPQPYPPTATNFYLNKKQYNTSSYWISGITYKWIAIKKWW